MSVSRRVPNTGPCRVPRRCASAPEASLAYNTTTVADNPNITDSEILAIVIGHLAYHMRRKGMVGLELSSGVFPPRHALPCRDGERRPVADFDHALPIDLRLRAVR